MTQNVQTVMMCYHCGNKTVMNWVAGYECNDIVGDITSKKAILLTNVKWDMYHCPVCSNITVLQNGEDIFDDYKGEILYPLVTHDAENMPKSVHQSFEAAISVRHIDGAICVLSLRRTLEKMCKDKGAVGRDLYSKLQYLSDNKILPPIIDQMANVLKNLGNAAAHADDIDFGSDLVNSMIEFTRVILDYVYNLPEKLYTRHLRILHLNA